MSKELVISANRHETKVALIDDDQLVEVYFQRSNEYSLAGSIHKGRVTRVLPGMQSAFVDLGLERDTFLYVSDFLEEHEDFDKVTDEKSERPSVERPSGDRPSVERPRQGRERGERDRGRDFKRREAAPASQSSTLPQAPSEGRPEAVAITAETAVEVEALAEGVEPDEVSTGEGPNEGTSEGEVAAGSTVDASGGAPGGERDRRGRRSRRRRRGGRGFPDSKYANESAVAEPVAAQVTAQSSAPPAASSAPDRQPQPHHQQTDHQYRDHPGHVAPIILPGESLAKYRNAPPVVAAAAPVHHIPADSHVDASENEVIENEYDEPVHYLPENALPDAPVHHPVVETTVIETPIRASHAAPKADIMPLSMALDSAPSPVSPSIFAPSPFATEEFAALHHAETVPGETESQPQASQAHDQRHRHDESRDDESQRESQRESAPAVAHMLDDDEDHDIQAMILGDVEGIEITQDEAEAERDAQAAGEAGGAEANAGTVESGSASVRERGGRYPHRVSRRRRRGGRGGDRGEARVEQPRGDQRPAEARSPATRGEEREVSRPEAVAVEALLDGTGEASPPEANIAGTPERAENRDRAERDRSEGRPENRSENRGDNRGGRGPHTSSGPGSRPGSRLNNEQPLISDLLKEGQEIIVQIAKEPLGAKGARITSHIALPGRYVVYMPTLQHMGVSRKIASDEERYRLKKVLQAQRPGAVGGFITRTAAEGRTEEEIAGDMQFLYNLWNDIKTRADKRPAPMMLHHDLDIVQRILRDQLADNFKAIWIDNEEHYESVLRFVETFQPALVPKVKLYTREAPIFDAFGVTAELEKALRPKVWLKSGGFIVINQTEALVAIDVNTGKYVGKTNRLEDTIVKTNTEAIKEIVRQIRLRDLGGIIVIDFIDMDERKNRAKVMQALEEAMRVDRAPYKILQFNDFGLVAITRKRVKQSLERTLCSPCPHCEGAGYVKSVQTVVSEILTEARKMAKTVDGKDVLLRVHPEVAKELKSQKNKFLEELEEVLRRPVLVKSDPLLHHEKFDLG